MRTASLLRTLWFLSCMLSFCTCASPSSLKLTAESIGNEDHIISITNSDLTKLEGPRDYYTLVVFTSTDEKHGCKQCLDLERSMRRVARSWYSDYADSNLLFFVKVDIVDRSNLKLFDHLTLTEVPHVWLFSPNSTADYDDGLGILAERHLVYRLPRATENEQALHLSQFLSEGLQKRILLREDNPQEKFIRNFAITFVMILLIKKKGPSFIKGASKKGVYSIVFTILTLVFVSGYSYSMMNGVPLVARDKEGNFAYVYPGQHIQVGFEIGILVAVYSSIAFSMVTLVYVGQYNVTESSKIRSTNTKNILIMLSVTILFLFYSCLTSLYLIKDRGYPYGLLKLF